MTTPLRTAILSYGMSGEIFHAPLLTALPEFELSSLVQRSKDHARQRYPRVRVCRTVEEVMADPSVELVIVNTPNELHVKHATAALEAGKHVVVEKPFTVSFAEAQQLARLAAERHLILTVFQNRRWDSDFLTVQKVLASGALGKVVEFEAHYDRFRNYIEPNTWKEVAAPGTGIVYNLGSHMIDQVLQLFGLPQTVDARIGIHRPGGHVDDYYDIRMQYEGLLVILKSSYLVCADLPRYIIHGTEGSFVKYGLDPQEQHLKEGRDPREPSWGREDASLWGKITKVENGKAVTVPVESLAGSYLHFYRNVFAAIREGAPLAVTPRQAADVIRLIEAAQESQRSGAAVRIK